MRAFILGSDSREHAFACKLKQEDKVSDIFAAPGNAGIAEETKIVDIEINDVEAVKEFIKENQIDLIYVGEENLCRQGLVDSLKDYDIQVIGPRQNAVQLNDDNLQKRRFLLNNNIPTVDCGMFAELDNARKYLEEADYPLQIRPAQASPDKTLRQPIATSDKKEAREVVERLLSPKTDKQSQGEGDSTSSASAGAEILIEEIPEGERVSVFALSDGDIILPLSSARIHRAVFEGGEGALTSGMGAYSPLPAVSFQTDKIIYSKIMLSLLEGLKQSGFTHQGFITAEIIITDRGPRVVDFQLNLSSTAAVTIIPRLNDSLSGLLQEAAEGSIQEKQVSWSQKTAVSIVITSGGYPLMHEEGFLIEGLEQTEQDNTKIFHISTRREDDKILTAGGRVIAVTALAEGHFSAVDRVNRCVEKINFQDMHYRTDIGSGAVLDISMEEIAEEEFEQDEDSLFEREWDEEI